MCLPRSRFFRVRSLGSWSSIKSGEYARFGCSSFPIISWTGGSGGGGGGGVSLFISIADSTRNFSRFCQFPDCVFSVVSEMFWRFPLLSLIALFYQWMNVFNGRETETQICHSRPYDFHSNCCVPKYTVVAFVPIGQHYTHTHSANVSYFSAIKIRPMKC